MIMFVGADKGDLGPLPKWVGYGLLAGIAKVCGYMFNSNMELISEFLWWILV